LDYKFFESLGREGQEEMFHGKPLMQQGFLSSSKVMILIEFSLSIQFIALMNLLALGLLVLLNTPMREFILAG
jgi:hypothetical protein